MPGVSVSLPAGTRLVPRRVARLLNLFADRDCPTRIEDIGAEVFGEPVPPGVVVNLIRRARQYLHWNGARRLPVVEGGRVEWYDARTRP